MSNIRTQCPSAWFWFKRKWYSEALGHRVAVKTRSRFWMVFLCKVCRSFPFDFPLNLMFILPRRRPTYIFWLPLLILGITCLSFSSSYRGSTRWWKWMGEREDEASVRFSYTSFLTLMTTFPRPSSLFSGSSQVLVINIDRHSTYSFVRWSFDTMRQKRKIYGWHWQQAPSV